MKGVSPPQGSTRKVKITRQVAKGARRRPITRHLRVRTRTIYDVGGVDLGRRQYVRPAHVQV